MSLSGFLINSFAKTQVKSVKDLLDVLCFVLCFGWKIQRRGRRKLT